jgi:hypothetical protein
MDSSFRSPFATKKMQNNMEKKLLENIRKDVAGGSTPINYFAFSASKNSQFFL